jgi:hypothetical protein
VLIYLGLSTIATFLAALVLLRFGEESPAAVTHLVFVIGIVPLIFGAITHFVPVLTRSGWHLLACSWQVGWPFSISGVKCQPSQPLHSARSCSPPSLPDGWCCEPGARSGDLTPDGAGTWRPWSFCPWP